MRRLDEVFPSLMANSAAAKVFLKMDTQVDCHSRPRYDLNVFYGAEGCLKGDTRTSVGSFCAAALHKPHYLPIYSPRMRGRSLAFIHGSVSFGSQSGVAGGGRIEENALKRRD